MFYVLTARVVKHNTGATEKFAPRTANSTSWHISGPFSSRKLAERSAAATLSTHTCLAAQVFAREALEKLASASSFDDYAKQRSIETFLKFNQELANV